MLLVRVPCLLRRYLYSTMASSLHNNGDLQVTFTSEGWQEAGQRMLVLDSSFNPPTRAHQALVQDTVSHFGPGFFDRCLLLYTTRNVDKVNATGASTDERMAMMTVVARKLANEQLATAVAKTPHGKFVDKATTLATQWPNCTPYFVLGYDTVTRFLDPKYYLPTPLNEALAPFFKHAQLVCADRPGYGDIESFWQSCAYKDKMTRIMLSDPAIAQLSSTLARQEAHCNNQSKLDTIVDPEVAVYIREKQLYSK
ncbi:Nucleotidylyl transferase [Lichtheimia hyalospora FSU 10163]|nr:Nucleotidylyl transferase [Lichtheimia hyalospora FSU 10163]